MKKFFIVTACLVLIALFFGFSVFSAEIFGNPDETGTTEAFWNTKRGIKAHLPVKAEIIKMSVGLKVVSGTWANVQGAIYDKNGNLIATTDTITFDSFATTTIFKGDLPFSENPVLEIDDYYLWVKATSNDVESWRTADPLGTGYKGISETPLQPFSEYWPDAVSGFFFDDVSVGITATYEIFAEPPAFYFEITDNFISKSVAYIGQATTGLGPLLYVIIGIPLGFLVVRKVIDFMPKK